MPFKQVINPKSRSVGIKPYVTGDDYPQQAAHVRNTEFGNMATLRAFELKKPNVPKMGTIERMSYLSQSERMDRVNRVRKRVNPWRRANGGGPTVHPDMQITTDGGVSGPLFTVEGSSYGGEKSLFWLYGYRKIVSARIEDGSLSGHVLKLKNSRPDPNFKDARHELYSYEITSNSFKKKLKIFIRYFDHISRKILSDTLEVYNEPAGLIAAAGVEHEVTITLGNDPTYDGSEEFPYESWGTVHDAASGHAGKMGGASCSAWIFYNGSWWTIARGFCTFDLSALSGTVIAAQIENSLSLTQVLSVQQGTQSDPVVDADYDQFTGNYFGKNTVGDATAQIIPFDEAGVAYLNSVLGSTAKLCLRDYTYDYLSVAPGSINESDELTSSAKLVLTIR